MKGLVLLHEPTASKHSCADMQITQEQGHGYSIQYGRNGPRSMHSAGSVARMPRMRRQRTCVRRCHGQSPRRPIGRTHSRSGVPSCRSPPAAPHRLAASWSCRCSPAPPSSFPLPPLLLPPVLGPCSAAASCVLPPSAAPPLAACCVLLLPLPALLPPGLVPQRSASGALTKSRSCQRGCGTTSVSPSVTVSPS